MRQAASRIAVCAAVSEQKIERVRRLIALGASGTFADIGPGGSFICFEAGAARSWSQGPLKVWRGEGAMQDRRCGDQATTLGSRPLGQVLVKPSRPDSKVDLDSRGEAIAAARVQTQPEEAAEYSKGSEPSVD